MPADLTDPDQAAQLFVMQWMHENGYHNGRVLQLNHRLLATIACDGVGQPANGATRSSLHRAHRSPTFCFPFPTSPSPLADGIFTALAALEKQLGKQYDEDSLQEASQLMQVG